MRWLGWCVLVIGVALRGGDAAAQSAAQFGRDVAFVSGEPVEHSIELPSGETMRFKVMMPPEGSGSGDRNRPRPVVLALPPGPQTLEMVNTSLELYWESVSDEHGWIVVSPEAPGRVVFHERDGSELDALHEWIMQNLRVRGKVHLAGVSNGGKSAFREALRKPGRYASLTGLPGVPASAEDAVELSRLRDIPVYLSVGELDRHWLEMSSELHRRLLAVGADAHLRTVLGAGHQLPGSASLGIARQIDRDLGLDRVDAARETPRAEQPGVDEAAARARPDVGAERAVRVVLDAFHRAAAEADGETYFGSFHETAVFLGTDGTERWDLASFRAFAEPYFNRASAWTYTPRVRHVDFSPDGAVAWFDEVLWNEKLGECRGSGVLLKTERGWKVAQYNLTMLVPNRSAAGVAALIRASADDEPTDDE